MNSHLLVRFVIIHLDVPGQDVSLEELDDLQLHKETDGHEVGEHQEPCSGELNVKSEPTFLIFVESLHVEGFLAKHSWNCGCVSKHPVAPKDRNKKTKQGLANEYHDNTLVSLMIKSRVLVLGIKVVHLNLSLLTSIDDSANYFVIDANF